jgi:predicted GIY-YIG superfamily endonuclease
MLTIYALQLETNKYYIGQTNRGTNATIRFQEHKSGKGSEWTKRYKPISIIETYETESLFEEDILTKKYMMKYGIENVRGGSYTKIDLDEWQIMSLEHEFKSVSDSCYKCGEKGHFAKDCDKCDKINKYLSQFTSEDDLEREIYKMEKLRTHFTNEIETIQIIIYIVLSEQGVQGKRGNNIERKIEIEPSIIDKYDFNNFTYEEHQRYDSSQDTKQISARQIYNHIINIINIIIRNVVGVTINPNNVIENIYKIYVNRVKRERDLKKLIHENGLDDVDSLKQINKRIENLYKKYAEILA